MPVKLAVPETNMITLKPRISVIGVGGGGGNAVNNMIVKKLEGVDLGATFEIPGLYSIDFMELYKTFGKHDPLPSYSLNFVSKLESFVVYSLSKSFLWSAVNEL